MVKVIMKSYRFKEGLVRDLGLNLLSVLFLFIIEKFDFLVEMPPEREVL